MTGPTWSVIAGDCRTVLDGLPDEIAQTVVTSPPYWGLRDYGVDGQIGLEDDPDDYVQALVDVFRSVRRVLRDDGTVWLNLGDTYAAKARGSDVGWDRSRLTNPGTQQKAQAAALRSTGERHRGKSAGLKEKDLIGIPWMIAFALRADGWYLRSDVIWHKPNGMPESVRDRPTRAHEHIFLLSKRARYVYDADAIREPDKGRDHPRTVFDGQPSLEPTGGLMAPHRGLRTPASRDGTGANKRDVWTVTTKPYGGAHFAAFPPDLIEPCVLAGAPRGAIVLDPFAGAGTTGLVAVRHGRAFVGIELNAEYAALARDRIATDIRLGHRPPRRDDDRPLQASLLEAGG